MQTHLRQMLLAIACLVVAASHAAAQETGSISGYVFDSTGAIVVGATITVTGEKLPGTRTAVKIGRAHV